MTAAQGESIIARHYDALNESASSTIVEKLMAIEYFEQVDSNESVEMLLKALFAPKPADHPKHFKGPRAGEVAARARVSAHA